MDRLLARLERRFGNFAIPNLATLIAGLSALVWVFDLLKPGFIFELMLIPQLVLRGQVWRLVTYLFIPPPAGVFWMIFAILFYWSLGQSLEQTWGKFKFNAYYLIGMIGTTAAAMILGLPMTSAYLHLSLLLAFGTIFPDHQFYVYFIIPVRAKWLALLDAAFLVYALITGGTSTRIAIAAAMANYLLFFTPDLIDIVRGMGVRSKQERRRVDFGPVARASARPTRACKICGKTDDDPDADLRVCTCQEVCGGKATVYCLEHARSHNRPN